MSVRIESSRPKREIHCYLKHNNLAFHFCFSINIFFSLFEWFLGGLELLSYYVSNSASSIAKLFFHIWFNFRWKAKKSFILHSSLNKPENRKNLGETLQHIDVYPLTLREFISFQWLIYPEIILLAVRRVIFNLEYNYNYHIYSILISQSITGSCHFVQTKVFVDESTSTLHSGLKHFVKEFATTFGFVIGICQFFKSFYHELILYSEH